ncbi:uncharacterized protein LOC116343820 isoform X1 [Contarinia nasturtii]|uniref:uncharacterized protein LOC116343820 isoform X1 n=1 Tax=Contarinia nasturtii TaxID=265458 RepID=UPI0012D3B077|nr:uncharacterized protein LOC116343820 isoform X1 [Contarinia nasturtii]
MPKYKQVKSLETLALRALTAYIRDLGEELMPLYTKAFELVMPDFHMDAMDLNAYDDEYIEDEIDFLDELEQIRELDLEQIRELARRRRKSSTKSLSESHRNSFTQKQLQEILRARVAILHDLFQYNVPCYLFDRLRMSLFSEIPRMVDRIKARRSIKTTQGEFMSQINVAVTLVETIIGPYLTYHNFEETPKVLQQIFYMRLKDMKGLEFLNLGSLTGGWKTDDMEPTIMLGLDNMSNLQYLSINYDCTDNLLLKLIEKCPRLTCLDLSSSKAVNDDSVNLLVRIPSLRFVNLHRTSVTMEGYIKLLLGLKKIEDIGPFDEIGRCLEYIADNYHDFKGFALKKFCSRYVTTRFLQIISEYCPEMQHVSIFFNMLICDLTALIGINKLSILHLLSCDFFSDQIRDVLAVKGCNLTHLHLEHVDQIDMNALMYISQYCPDLQVFTIYNCEMIESTSLYLQKPSIPPFMNLEKLTVIAQCDRRHLEFLWSTCLQIKVIKCGMMVPTTDELFEYILSRNPMEHLEELSILRSDGLTIGMAYKFVEICPKLTQLNELEGWSLIKEDELQLFKTFIKTNNLELNIESKRFQTTAEELI